MDGRIVQVICEEYRKRFWSWLDNGEAARLSEEITDRLRRMGFRIHIGDLE